MNKFLKNTLKVSASLALGIFIFWLAYRQMDTKQIFEILSGNVRYEYIWIGVFIGILADVFRALRWKMQIDALEEQKPTVINTLFAVMIGYFVNFLVPRAGEVVRCGIINRYHKIAFTKVLGTMIAERAFDFIVLLSLIAFGALIQMNLFMGMFSEHVSFSHPSMSMVYWLIGICAFLLLLWLFRKRIRETFAYRKFVALVKDIWIGIKTSLRLKRRYLFFLYTIGIWGCYFLMLYIPVFAFDFTSELSIAAIFFTFIMGSLGTVAPVQGGIGTFHFMTIASLTLFGIGKAEAGAFALIVHGSQMASYMIGGILSFIGLPLVNSGKKAADTNNTKE